MFERHQRRLGPAGGDDHHVAVDQRRLGVGPHAGLAAEVLAQALAPLLLAVGGVHADEVAVGPEGVDAVAVHGRGGAGGRVLRPLVRADLPELRRPELLAVLRAQGGDELVVLAPVGGQVDAVAGHGHGPVPAAEVGRLPGELRPVLRPLLEQAGFGRDAVAVRPAPLGPVGRADRGPDREGDKKSKAHEVLLGGEPTPDGVKGM